MDPATQILIPGFLGGLVIALFVIWRQRAGQTHSPADPFSGASSTDVINMARIRVAGVGGLGLVAMSILVAVFVPRIRLSMVLGLGLGAVWGAILILRRQRQGPMPSSGQRLGANTTLSIDAPSPADERRRDPPSVRVQDVAALPASR